MGWRPPQGLGAVHGRTPQKWYGMVSILNPRGETWFATRANTNTQTKQITVIHNTHKVTEHKQTASQVQSQQCSLKNFKEAGTKDLLNRSVEHRSSRNLSLNELRWALNTLYRGWPSKERIVFSFLLVLLVIVVSKESGGRPLTEPALRGLLHAHSLQVKEQCPAFSH